MIRLQQVGGPLRFTLRPGRRVVLGRAAECDLIIPDPAVSRRHAELEVEGEALRVRDLESANGTSLNGASITEGTAAPDDVVTFGATAFRVTAPGGGMLDELPSGTAVRSLVDLLPTAGHDRQALVMDRLLAVAADLSGDVALDGLLETITDLTFDQVDADRAALLLLDLSGTLEQVAARSRVGEAAPQVPRAIAERTIRDRAPVVTESALEDERFQSGSVRLQAVRSALCAPLLAPDDRVLGVLYADTITRPTPFGEEEAAALMAFAGLAAVTLARARYAEEARREREIRQSLERFFAPDVAATIAERGAEALAGSRREAAVLFSDIRGFTTLAENLSPEETARLLADYFGVMVDVVFEHGGTLDKFIGDAMMAVWGAPVPAADAVDRALAAAKAMGRELAALNAARGADGRPPIEAGIGIGYGPLFAGNIGSARRLEYTVVGDPVNIAAHLCAAAGPGEILLTEEAVRRLRDRSRVQPATTVELKGGRIIRTFRA